MCALSTACTDDEEPASTNVRKRGVQLAPAPPSTPAPQPLPEQPTAPPALPNEAPPDEPREEAATLPAEQAAPDDPEKPPRNMSAELESMIGSPASCLAPRPANEAPSQVSISLGASVMPSGAVGRGEVSAPGLSPTELDCVRKRLESVRFAPPIENAPFTVNASITLNRGK